MTRENSSLGRENGQDKKATAFKTISEVAEILDVQQHVLRFWETKFSLIQPLKRGGGRRYYRPEDVDLLLIIHRLLYTDGYTIKGVQKLFKGMSKRKVIDTFKHAQKIQNNNAFIREGSNDQSNIRSFEQASPNLNKEQTASERRVEFTKEQKLFFENLIKELEDLKSLIDRT